MIDIVEPTRGPAEQVVDVLVGSFGLVGAIATVALVIGGLIGGLMLWLRSGNPLSRS
jgi:hypothetical protein